MHRGPPYSEVEIVMGRFEFDHQLIVPIEERLMTAELDLGSA